MPRSGDPNEKPSSKEIAAANELAKSIAIRKGLFNAQNFNVGNQIPKFLDEKGSILPSTTQSKLPPGTISDIRQIPTYVKNLEWDKETNAAYYTDEKTGYLQYVHPDIFYSSRFNPNRGTTSNTIFSYAKR